MTCTSSRNSFRTVESTTDEKGEGIEQTEAETATSEEVSWPRQLGAQRSPSFGAWVKGAGVPALRVGEGGSRGACTRQTGFKKAGVLRVNMSNHRPLIN